MSGVFAGRWVEILRSLSPLRSFTMSRGPASAALLKSSARQNVDSLLLNWFPSILSFYRKKVRLRSFLNLFSSRDATRRLSFYFRIIILISAVKEREKRKWRTNNIYDTRFRSPLLTVRRLPPFTILPEVILTLLNAPCWRTGDRRPSPNYPGFPTMRPVKNGDTYKWPMAARRVHSIPPVTNGDILFPVYRASKGKSDGMVFCKCMFYS